MLNKVRLNYNVRSDWTKSLYCSKRLFNLSKNLVREKVIFFYISNACTFNTMLIWFNMIFH